MAYLGWYAPTVVVDGEHMIEQILKVKDATLLVLEEYPEARGNDNILAQKVYSLLGHRSFIPYDAPPVESITRARRLIQERGYYIPDTQIKLGRQEEAENMKQLFGEQRLV